MQTKRRRETGLIIMGLMIALVTLQILIPSKISAQAVTQDPPALQGLGLLEAPLVYPGTRPLYIADPVAPPPGEREGFACFGACGASCACASKQEFRKMLRVADNLCVYKVVTCRSHPFCAWHDACYLTADRLFPEPSQRNQRMRAYRSCDLRCLSDDDLIHDGIAPLMQSELWPSDLVSPNPPTGRYSANTCIAWARSDTTSPAATYQGEVAFSELQFCR